MSSWTPRETDIFGKGCVVGGAVVGGFWLIGWQFLLALALFVIIMVIIDE